jgi:hypothetical protein
LAIPAPIAVAALARAPDVMQRPLAELLGPEHVLRDRPAVRRGVDGDDAVHVGVRQAGVGQGALDGLELQ